MKAQDNEISSAGFVRHQIFAFIFLSIRVKSSLDGLSMLSLWIYKVRYRHFVLLSWQMSASICYTCVSRHNFIHYTSLMVQSYANSMNDIKPDSDIAVQPK